MSTANIFGKSVGVSATPNVAAAVPASNSAQFAEIFGTDLRRGTADVVAVQSQLSIQTNEAEQKSREWFRARVGKFTASGMPDLMTSGRGKERFGKTAINYVLKIAAERDMTPEGLETYLDEQVKKEFRQTMWGNTYEADARIEAGKLIRCEIQEVTFAKCPDSLIGDFFGGSADGVTETGIPVEIKCPYDPIRHEQNLQLKLIGIDVKHDYYPQMQAHMINFNADKCYFVSYDPRRSEARRVCVIEVNRDQDYINEMAERLKLANIAVESYLNDGVPIEQMVNDIRG